MEVAPKLPMLSCEIKHSPSPVDFSKPLKKYIREYYNEDPESYNKEIKELETLRQLATKPSRDYNGCSTLKRYFSQLLLLQNRFPIHEDGAAAIPFVWNDVYTGTSSTVSNIKYEQACILYNIGALHSELGALDNRDDAEGMKIACTHFQCATWAFQHLRDNYPQPRGSDMAHDILSFLVYMMLAQAQECILEKSMLDSRKSSITSKVAFQVVEFYRSAHSLLSSSISDIVGSRNYKSWKIFLEFKIAFYKCISHLYMGKLAEEQQKMGERVSWYQSAADKLTEAIKIAKNSDRLDIQEILVLTQDVVIGRLESAKKENDFIYHEKVADATTLPEVKGAPLVKGIAFDPKDPEVCGPDIFARLVPMGTHEAASMYSEKKASLLRKVLAEIEIKNNEFVTYMSSLQLDPTLLSPEAPQPLPQDFLEACANLSADSGAATPRLSRHLQQLSEECLQVEELLQEIKLLLEQEEQREAAYQKVFGKRPTPIVSQMKKELNRLEEAHAQAKESNLVLKQMLVSHIPNLELLSGPFEKLQEQLPSFQSLEIDHNALSELKRLLDKAEEMRKQREMLENRFRDELQKDDITKALMIKDEKESITAIFDKELEKHTTVVNLLDQNMAAQENILRALTQANANFADSKKLLLETMEKRKEKIQSLIASYHAFEDLNAKCQQGLEFYAKLHSNARKLMDRVKSVTKVQEEERAKQKHAQTAKAQLHSKPAGSTTPKLKDYLPYMTGQMQNLSMASPLPPDSMHGQPQAYDTSFKGPSYSYPTSYPQPAQAQQVLPMTTVAPPAVPPAATYGALSQPYQVTTLFGQTMSKNKITYTQGTFPENFNKAAGLSYSPPSSYVDSGGQYSYKVATSFPANQNQVSGTYPPYSTSTSGTPANYQFSTNVAQGQMFPSSQLIYSQSTAYGQGALGSQTTYSQHPYSTAATSGLGGSYTQQPPTTTQAPGTSYYGTQQSGQYNYQSLPSSYIPNQYGYNPDSGYYIQQPASVSQQPLPTVTIPGQPQTTSQISAGYNQDISSSTPPPLVPSSVPQNQPYSSYNYSLPVTSSQTPPIYTQASHVIPETSVSQQVPYNGGLTATSSSQMQGGTSSHYPASQDLSSQAAAPQHTSQLYTDTYSQASWKPYVQQDVPISSAYLPTGSAVVNASTDSSAIQQAYVAQNYNIQTSQTYQNYASQPTQAYASPPTYGVQQNQNFVPQMMGTSYPSQSQQSQEYMAQPAIGGAPFATSNYLGQSVQGYTAPSSVSTYNMAPSQLPSSSQSSHPSRDLLSESIEPAPNSPLLTPNKIPLTTTPEEEKKVPTANGLPPTTKPTEKKQDSDDQESLPSKENGSAISSLPSKEEPAPKEESNASASNNKTPNIQDQLNDTKILERFVLEVDKFDKVVEGLTKKSLNGPTPLDQKWKDLLDTQEKEGRKKSISVARCYPLKNRFPEIMPFDVNRVELTSTKNDYINASHVKDLISKYPHYIITQAPLPATYEEFWCMVWEQQVEVIACLLSDQELKSHIYWPQERGQTFTAGRFQLTLQSSNKKPNMVERVISIVNTEQKSSRVVIHLQFLSWTSSLLPPSPAPLLQYISEVHTFYNQQRSRSRPLLVHCSGGAGRSGVFCILSAALLALPGTFPDPSHLATQLCQQRKHALQEKDQLRFCYEALLYYMQSQLVQRGILSNKSSFEPPQHKRTHSRHPSEDFILGDAGSSKMPKEGSSATQVPSIPVSKESSSILSMLDPDKFSLDPTVSPGHKKITKKNFSNSSHSLLGAQQVSPSDPLSQLDPLWSLKK